MRHWRKIEGSRSEKSGSFPCPLPSGSRPVGSPPHSSQLASESRASMSLDLAAWPCLATPLPLDRHSQQINLREVLLKKPAYPGSVLCFQHFPPISDCDVSSQYTSQWAAARVKNKHLSVRPMGHRPQTSVIL